MTTATYANRPHHLDLANQIARSIPSEYAHSRMLLAIAQFCRFKDGAWIAWPSIDTLRKSCGYSDARNVRVMLSQLQKLGLITIFRRDRSTNLYALHITRIAAFDPVRAGLRKA
ncbi:MAG: helix-turn-helix domain-containing protein, partial [Aeromonas sp.]